jgi:hypothetical protein
MRYLTSLLNQYAKFFAIEHNEKRTIFGLVFLLLSLLIFLVKASGGQGNVAIPTEYAATPVPATWTITPTQWWIKMSATPPLPVLLVSTSPVESKTSTCLRTTSLTVRASTYAYVAQKPRLPNRLRARASLSGEYIGQIESGAGLRIIDGPICADGYAWWLVESLDKRLRGWTVEGRDSEQWLIPCPSVDVQCNFLATPIPSTSSAPHDNSANLTENTCRSDKLAIGTLAHGDQDSLLVIRTEPSIGAVIGHAGPMSIASVMEGPSCAGGAIWWKVNVLDLGLIGWTTENYLEACPKDSPCGE